MEFSHNKHQLKEAELRDFLFALIYSPAEVSETILQGFPSLQGAWEPKGTSCLPRRVRPAGLRPSRTGFQHRGGWALSCALLKEPPAAALLSLSLMLTFSGLLTDRRPCARSSRLLRNLSRSSTSRNRKKTSLHSGWVSNNLQSDTRRTELTQKHPTAGGRRSRDLGVASVQLIATVYPPAGLLSRDLIVPSSSHSSSCNLQSACRYFFLLFFFFVNLPSKNHQDRGQMVSLLWLTTPPNQFSLTAELFHCAAIQSESSPASSWAAASSGPGLHACYKLRLFALNLVLNGKKKKKEARRREAAGASACDGFFAVVDLFGAKKSVFTHTRHE